jgi:hypothetical protein
LSFPSIPFSSKSPVFVSSCCSYRNFTKVVVLERLPISDNTVPYFKNYLFTIRSEKENWTGVYQTYWKLTKTL